MASGLMVIAVDELSTADQQLRAQARRLEGAADDLVVSTGDLPPEAQSIVAGLPGLRNRVESAARQLRTAADTFGTVAAEAVLADGGGLFGTAFGGLLMKTLTGLKGDVIPPGGYGPFGPVPWIAGRFTLVAGAADTIFSHRYGYPWADGTHWRVYGTGPYLSPKWRGPVEWAGKVGKYGGLGITLASTFSQRLNRGESVPQAAGGAGVETASMWACATAGARVANALPIPNPFVKGGAILIGGAGAGAACSTPGRWLGDRASAIPGRVVDGAKIVGNDVKNTTLDGVKILGRDVKDPIVRGATTVGNDVKDTAVDGVNKVGSGLSTAGGFVKKNVLDKIPTPDIHISLP
ncbi:MAG: hypothetical protein J2P15_10965 [Micromonosporaceae bacterium]|nr:hypothetical protein [Micromonosporaceae bacterium]